MKRYWYVLLIPLLVTVLVSCAHYPPDRYNTLKGALIGAGANKRHPGFIEPKGASLSASGAHRLRVLSYDKYGIHPIAPFPMYRENNLVRRQSVSSLVTLL